MKLVILAATGGIGRHLLGQALDAGHDITAVVRRPAALPAGVRTVTTDLSAADPVTLESAVAGADAVLSGLGARTKADTGVASRGTRSIVDAMRATGTRRIVVVSAAPIGTVAVPGRTPPPRQDPGDGFVMRHLLTPLVRVALREHYADLAAMEAVLADSELDWTAVRPPKLTDKPLTGEYRTAYGRNIRGGWAISRADVAHYMLHAVDLPDTVGQAVGLAS